MNTSFEIRDSNTTWFHSIELQIPAGKSHPNPNKHNHDQQDSSCKVVGCTNIINKRKMSGLCKAHESSVSDLYLKLYNGTTLHTAPRHLDIIDHLIQWSRDNEAFGRLNHFVHQLSFEICGNIPDVNILSNQIRGYSESTDAIQKCIDKCLIEVEKYLPKENLNSYSIIETKSYRIPVRSLATTFSLLVLCEEANRGDRWFSLKYLGGANKATSNGGLMPLMYYAIRTFGIGFSTKTARVLF